MGKSTGVVMSLPDTCYFARELLSWPHNDQNTDELGTAAMLATTMVDLYTGDRIPP